MSLAKSYWMIIAAFIFYSIGNTVWFLHHYSFLMKLVPREKRGKFFGSVSSLEKLIGMGIPLLSGVLVNRYGFFIPFSLSFLAFLQYF